MLPKASSVCKNKADLFWHLGFLVFVDSPILGSEEPPMNLESSP